MPTWTVVSQRYGERYMQNGTFQQVVTVGVQASDGSYADIIVPQAQYTPENVKALIDDWYATHLAVSQVQGT